MATVAAMLGAVAMIGAGGVMAAPALADDTAATAGGGSIEIESPQKVNGDNMIAPPSMVAYSTPTNSAPMKT